MDLPESQDIFTDFWKLANGATEHEARGVPSVAVPSEKTYEALTKPCFRSNWSPGTLLQLLVLRLGWLQHWGISASASFQWARAS